MRQLALQIQSSVSPTLDNFVSGRNAEAIAALRGVVRSMAHDTLLYLWGPEGSGKSHLLAGLAAGLSAAGRPARSVDGATLAPGDPLTESALLVDNVQALAPPCAERLFHAWNRIRDEGGMLVCAGLAPPAALPLAPELASRLGWGAIHRLHALDDDEKCAALRARAEAQGIPVADDALRYLLSRARRDLPSLMALLAELDELSLATQRAITVPLVRELLQSRPDSIALQDVRREPACD